MATVQHTSRTTCTVASILQIGFSCNTKCAVKDGFTETVTCSYM